MSLNRPRIHVVAINLRLQFQLNATLETLVIYHQEKAKNILKFECLDLAAVSKIWKHSSVRIIQKFYLKNSSEINIYSLPGQVILK